MQRGPPLEVLCHLTFDHAQISMGRKNGRRTDSILRVGSMDFVEEVVTSNSPTRSSCSFPLSSTESDCDDDILTNSGPERGLVEQPPTTLYWVRMSALRNHDNEAFTTAISDPNTRFRAVFIIDPWYMCAEGKKKLGLNRLRFLLESLWDLHEQLKEYNTFLYVIKGHPLASLEKVCEEWNVTRLVFQADRELRSRIVEDKIEKLASTMNIEVLKYQGHTLYDTHNILKKVNQQIRTVKDFRDILPFLGPPNPPCDTPQPSSVRSAVSEKEELPDEYIIPSLSDFGYLNSETLYSNPSWRGGETEALRRLSVYMESRKEMDTTFIGELVNSTSLSPYIRFGCLSVRYFFWKLKEMVLKDTAYEKLSREVIHKLLQREFYFTVSSQVPNFDQVGNSICLQVPWEKDDEMFKCWKDGRTGYPWIDAAMRQLKQEGWIHYYLRESVATFLTRGDLWLSWTEGLRVFEELLLDFEPSVSCGCWMKSSCSAFITGPVEHYCPITFGKKLDPKGEFIRRYIPELKDFPDEYIYSPWMAPPKVQTKSKCQIGIDYPNPIVDHRTAGVLCCEKLRSLMSMLNRVCLEPA